MKIAVYWKSELWGGSDTHLLTLLRNWPNKQDEIVLFYNWNNQGYDRIASDLKDLQNVESQSFDPVFEMAREKGTQRKRSKFRKVVDYIGKPYLFWLMTRQARRLLAQAGDLDAVLADDGGYPAAWESLAAIMAAKQLGIPKRMLLIHHCATEPGIYTWAIFERLVDRMMSRNATDLVAVSQATRQSLLDRRWFNTGMNPIRVIYNGIDFKTLEKHKNVAAACDLRQTLPVGDSLMFGIMGRIERIKGHEDLLAGFSLLPKAYQQKIKLLFIGDGDTAEICRLQRMAGVFDIGDSIIFTGYLPGAPQAILQQLDLLVVMSKEFEGFGLTLGEAMSAGTPVLATSVGAIPEFIDNSVGFLVSPESPHEVCRVIRAFIDNRDLFHQKAALARTRIREFSAERMATQFHSLLTLN